VWISGFELGPYLIFTFLQFAFKEQGTRFKSIGKAVTKGTQQIGKTLTILADSPDKRAQERLAKIHTPQFYERSARKGNLKDVGPSFDDGSLGMDTGESWCWPLMLNDFPETDW
jgi:hypothetical protein